MAQALRIHERERYLAWLIDNNVLSDAATSWRERPRLLAIRRVAQRFNRGDAVYVKDIIGVCIVNSVSKELTASPARITYSLTHAGAFIMKADGSGIAWFQEQELMSDIPQSPSMAHTGDFSSNGVPVSVKRLWKQIWLVWLMSTHKIIHIDHYVHLTPRYYLWRLAVEAQQAAIADIPVKVEGHKKPAIIKQVLGVAA